MELTNKPLFSVIVPTYNHAHLINKCLDSIIAQTYNNFEVIVINNYSEDNTIEVIEAYNDHRIKLINFRNNGIIGASRNVGIKNSTGAWICFLDSDDWWYPNKLEICSDFLDRYNLIYHDLEIYTIEGKALKSKINSRNLKGDIFRDLIIHRNAISNSSVVVKKELLIKVGGISEERELIAVEDYDCWIRIAEIDNKFKYIKKSLGAYWMGNNISAASEKIIQAEQFVTNKFIERLNDHDKYQTLCNLSYKLGRLYQKLNNNEKSFYHYTKSLHSKSFIIKLKSTLLILTFKIKLLVCSLNKNFKLKR